MFIQHYTVLINLDKNKQTNKLIEEVIDCNLFGTN